MKPYRNNKKKYLRIATVLSFVVILSAMLLMSYAVEWTDETAIAVQNAMDSGMSVADAFESVTGIVAPIHGGPGSGGSSASYTAPSAPAPAATPAPAAPTTTAVDTPAPVNKKDSAKAAYPHDYDEINETAKEAFVYFTKDGTPDSVYLNIKASSSQNVITGKELNATTTGKEDGRISYVNEDNEMVYEWLFSNWQSDDAYELDLGVTFDKSENSDFEESYDFVFADGKEIEDNDVIFRIRTELPDTDLNIYKKTDSGYDGVYTGKTDENGILELHPKELTDYVVSPGEPVEAVEEPAEEEPVEETAEVVEQEEVEEIAEEPVGGEPVTEVESDTEVEVSEDKGAPFLLFAIGGVCVLAVGVGIGAVVLKRKRD